MISLRTPVGRGKTAAVPQIPGHSRLLLTLSVLLIAANSLAAEPTTDPGTYAHGAVAADHPLASAAGVETLQRGGNVIDAAVATAFTLSVVRPESSGLGGGGFLVYWNAEEQRGEAWDYRERAPLAAGPDMYIESKESGRDAPSRRGIRAAAVPGHIPGLCEIHGRYGKLPLKDVLRPALRVAIEGVPVDEHMIAIQRERLREFSTHPEYRTRYRDLWTGYLNSGVPWKEGDRFLSPQRRALEWIAELGASAYADGPIGDALILHSQKLEGLWTKDDLRQMSPVRRDVLSGEYSGYRILTMPPPSSGGVALLETLNILSAWKQRPGHVAWKELPEADRAHLLVEALKHAFADRAEFLGDADFVDVPVERLISRAHAERLAARIDLARTQPPERYGRFELPDDSGTTHFCVMDAAGNAVACTETINTTFGSYVVEPTTGIVLNNEMDDFTAVPGQPNAFGLQQSAANVVAPRKKPLSSMTPTIVLRDGRAVAIAGASGGPRIITATLQVLLQILEFDASARAAVQAPRLHHQWLPDELLIERDGHDALSSPLESRGHRVIRSGGLAATQAIRFPPGGRIEPASDPRKHGQPAGY